MNLPYQFSGIVVQGNQLGRTIGFPTANLLPNPEEVLPLDRGVYAVKIILNNQHYQGMANVGIKPTLGLTQLTIEINLFDFSADIYGCLLEVTFLEFIRPEQKFSGLEALKEQIKLDEALIRRKLL